MLDTTSEDWVQLNQKRAWFADCAVTDATVAIFAKSIYCFKPLNKLRSTLTIMHWISHDQS